MPQRTAVEIRSELSQRGIHPGASVTYTTFLGNTRYGCVLDTDDDIVIKGRVMVQLHNAALPLPAATLVPCPHVSDPVQFDYLETYANA